MTIDPVVAVALSLVLAGVIASAGLHKLRAPLHYGAVVDAYRLLPQGAGRVAAVAIGALELLAGLAILLPAAHRSGLLVAAALFALYFAAIAINLGRGRRDIDCGCGAPAQRQGLSAALLARNAVLIAAALGLAFAQPASRALGWFDAVVVLGAAIALALIYLSFGLLLSNKELLAQLK